MKLFILILTLFVQIVSSYSQCENFNHNFLWQPSCTSPTDYVTTNTPKSYLPYPTLIWKQSSAQYQVLYNFDQILTRDPSWFPPSGRHVVEGRYNKDELIPLLHSAKNKWLNLCSYPDLIWSYNSYCRFYWGEDIRIISPGQTSKVYFHLEQPNPYKIVPINGQCNPDKVGSTLVVFNNTEEFYFQSPQLRWTTKTPENKNQLSFLAIALHTIGHYLGLANQWSSDNKDNYVMNDNLNSAIYIQQCEADSYRMLYCPDDVGNPVFVEENYLGSNSDDIDLNVYPNPNNTIVNVSFKSEEKGPITILLRNLEGRLTKILSQELIISSDYKSSFVISDLSDGLYFLTVIIGSKSFTTKLLKQ